MGVAATGWGKAQGLVQWVVEQLAEKDPNHTGMASDPPLPALKRRPLGLPPGIYPFREVLQALPAGRARADIVIPIILDGLWLLFRERPPSPTLPIPHRLLTQGGEGLKVQAPRMGQGLPQCHAALKVGAEHAVGGRKRRRQCSLSQVLGSAQGAQR